MPSSSYTSFCCHRTKEQRVGSMADGRGEEVHTCLQADRDEEAEAVPLLD